MQNIIESIRRAADILTNDSRSDIIASAEPRGRLGVELHALAASIERGVIIGAPEVYVVRPVDEAEDIAAFARQEDSERYQATFDVENVGDVEAVIVCDEALAAKMIRERIEAEDPDDENGISAATLED